MRAFFAIDLPNETKSILASHAKAWDTYRKVRPDNFHVTLVFLGEVDKEKIDLYANHAEIVAKNSEPFELSFDLLTTKRDMLWAVPSTINHALEKLGSDLSRTLETTGLLSPSPLPFRPHVKLGYTDQMGRKPFTKIEFTVKTFHLYKTEFLPQGGVRYHILETFRLDNK